MAGKILGLAATGPNDAVRKSELDAAIAAGGIVVSATAPVAPVNGTIWFDSTTGLTYIRYVDADSAQWVGVLSATGPAGDPATNLVTSVSGKQGIVTLVSDDVGLANVDNTTDDLKPVSSAQQTALNLKSDTTQVETFLVSGTWTKPAGCVSVHVSVVGGGGGGGSGRRGATSTARHGGNGGSGGGYTRETFPASGLPSTVAITVGTGGSGGAALTTDDAVGLAASSGITSSFGIFARALGGQGGNGGNVSTTSATSVGLNAEHPGGNGGGTSGTASGFAGNPARGGTGGGGGGGVSATNVAASGGGGGQALMTSVGGGGNIGTFGTVGGNGFSGAASTFISGAGVGGGGGGGGSAGAGGSGGNGVVGGGGAGGGASTNGFNSGAGGNGGPGRVIVTSYF